MKLTFNLSSRTYFLGFFRFDLSHGGQENEPDDGYATWNVQ